MQNKIKFVLDFIKEMLLFPFQYDLIYFLLLWIVMALPNCLSQFIRGNIAYTLYLLMLYYATAYIITVILNLHKIIALIARPVVLIFGGVYALLNWYCLTMYGDLLSYNFIQIIAGTNPNEAKEYFETFVTWQQILLFALGGVIITLASIYLAKRRKKKYRRIWVVAGGLLILSIAAIYHNSAMIEEELFDKEFWVFKFEEVVDLRKHPTYPKIEKLDSIPPAYIIIILGESFSLNHSSLYGYKKHTNPMLEKKANEGSLIIFKNITSPCTYTTATFKYLLNTYQIGHENGKRWYEHTNLIEVMNMIGYHTIWISNQAEKGMFDNLPSGHSKLCKEMFFLENDNKVFKYDGGLIGKASLNKDKCVTFYHLMGQHPDFQQRYPQKYENFEAKDYANYPEHQKDILAAYDNATLYNDFVVSSIMDLYKEKNAIVFYFSDHGLDIFDTDPQYFGHAKMTEASQAHCKKIPFMVYASPVFQEHHFEKVEMMRKAVNNPFCTDKLIYTVMDIAGLKFADNDDVHKYSLFSEN